MPVTHLTDFSDRLSPMLVKELRQGMRARSFTMLFLTFQLLLAFILLIAGSVANSEDAGSIVSGVIFTMFAIATLFIQPMRGNTALSGEISGNTIEMMVLTRLSATRIVLGKWIAIVSQSALILITIIPYLILRYFYGGMVLFGEMVFLMLIFLTSMALTAVTVGLSGNQTKMFRALPVIGFIFLMQAVSGLFFRSAGFGEFVNLCTMSDWRSRAVILGYLVFISYFSWCALSHGISVIAPVAENHSTVRRLVALALALIAVAVGHHNAVSPLVMPLVFGIILAPAVITALTEKSTLLPPVCVPFLKRRLPGELAGYFLLPGWPSGIFYTALLLAISVCGIIINTVSKPGTSVPVGAYISSLSILGAILLSALLASTFTKQESKRLNNFIIFLLASVICMIGPMVITNINNCEKYLWFFIWNPLVFLPMLGEREFEKAELLNAVLGIDALILCLLLICGIIAFRRYRDIFRDAREEIARHPSSPTSP